MHFIAKCSIELANAPATSNQQPATSIICNLLLMLFFAPYLSLSMPRPLQLESINFDEENANAFWIPKHQTAEPVPLNGHMI